MTFPRLIACVPLLATLLSCSSLQGGIALPAQVERFEIVSRAPAFGGTVFDGGGEYEAIFAVAHMKVDPRDPANRQIADIDKAPTQGGWVRYKTEVTIVRPRDPAKASRVLLVDIPNRGNRLFLQMVNDGGAELAATGGAGNGFTMRRGHTMAWIGWQGDVALGSGGAVTGAEFPVALDGGEPVVGPSFEEAVFNDSKPLGTMLLAYPAASLDQGQAVLSVRAHAGAAHQVMPPGAWRFRTPSEIEITRAPGFDGGAIYQFQYQARDPKVMGLGMAALRDVTSFLKKSPASPVADIRPDVAVAVGVSQSGRFLRDLIWQGFTADLDGAPVFDGAMPLIAGSRKSFVNQRFAQPGRYSTQHLDHLRYGDQFPFSYAVTTDPVSGARDGIFARCENSRTCPKLMHVDSSVEFWQGRASLVVTDGAGKDIALPDGVRTYLMASTQHMAAARPALGNCKYNSNPAQQGPAVRALLDGLVEWARSGKEPPASRYPRHADSMLTAPERDAVGFPDLRVLGVEFPRVINRLTVVDYSRVPPQPDLQRPYQLFVPMADADGNDIAGIRLPDVAVPLATYTGWNLRRANLAEGQLCDLNGSTFPLPARPRAGDPRRAIAQRYATRLDYAKAVALAARELRDQGLMLQEDVDIAIERARIEPRVNP